MTSKKNRLTRHFLSNKDKKHSDLTLCPKPLIHVLARGCRWNEQGKMTGTLTELSGLSCSTCSIFVFRWASNCHCTVDLQVQFEVNSSNIVVSKMRLIYLTHLNAAYTRCMVGSSKSDSTTHESVVGCLWLADFDITYGWGRRQLELLQLNLRRRIFITVQMDFF